MNHWSDWHLTPTGWVRGTVHRAGDHVEVLPPSDRVLSYRVVVRQEGRLERWVIWRSTGNDAKVAALIAEHGDGPGEPRNPGRGASDPPAGE